MFALPTLTRRLLFALALIGLAACGDRSPTAEPGGAGNTEAAAAKVPAATRGDPHSYAEPEVYATRHLDLDLTVDFGSRTLAGMATLTLEAFRPGSALILDARDLAIERVETASGADGEPVWTDTSFTFGASDALLGSPLTILMPADARRVRLHYRTSPEASGLQWLESAQTADRNGPFLFTQSQAIHARSWIPLQDTPRVRFTYEARIRTPDTVLALMSADNEPGAARDGDYRFRMPQPIPSYLMALAAGDLAFQPIGERTGIYAEPSVIAAAAHEFEDTEAMLDTAEAMYGPYRWGRYDLLILPPSFPYGGMENPRLTFATPTVIAGDKSLVALVAHELAHSWSGNLVTNASWRDFWLNEGFTTYFTNRIMEAVYGRDRALMEQALEAQDIERALAELDPAKTALAADTPNQDPDDNVGPIAYDKGALFLHNLEARFGRETFDAFLKGWFDGHAFQSRSTEDFVAWLDERLIRPNPGKLTLEQAKAWIYQPGLPADARIATSEAFGQIDAQRGEWLAGTRPVQTIEAEGWNVLHWQHFLDNLPASVTLDQLAELDRRFSLTQSTNRVLAKSWFLVTIRAGYAPAYPALEAHLKSIGRMYLIAPLYRELAKSPEGLERARKIYAEARAGYHPIARSAVEKALAAPEPGKPAA